MGDPVVLTDTSQRSGAAARFVVGLCGLFVCSFAVALTVAVVVLALWPGLDATVASSGSMQPVIRRGDVVVFRSTSIDDVVEGDVIVFDDDAGGSTVHRVVKVGDDHTLTTRGDANQIADTGSVVAGELHGRGTVLVPWIGLPRLWLGESNLAALATTLITVCLAGMVSRWACDRRFDPWSLA